MRSEVCETCRYFDPEHSCCHLRMVPVQPDTRACPQWESLADYAARVGFVTLVAVGFACAFLSLAAAALAR